MTGNDILVKTALGQAEIDNHQGILPREARTLLILIDGRHSIEHYRSKLNNSQMFADAGGVEQFIQILLDLEYVATKKGDAASAISPEPTITSTQPIIPDDAPTVHAEVVVLEERREERASAAVQQPTPAEPIVADTSVSLDTIRTQIAEFLESQANAADSWSWLMKLESCQSHGDYLRLIRSMQERMDKLPRTIVKLAKSLEVA